MRKEFKIAIKKAKKKILLTVFLIFTIFLGYKIRYNYYHPSLIKEGNNPYEIGFLGFYNLEKQGLNEFIDIMSKTENQQSLNTNISQLRIDLTKKGNIKTIYLALNYFDDDFNFIGRGYYDYQNKNLVYHFQKKDECSSVSECQTNHKLVEEYQKSLNIKYLSPNFQKIPYQKQIKLSNLKHYQVSLEPNYKFAEPTSVFDLRFNKKISPLTLNDYKAGNGGNVNSGIYLVIRLNDGSSQIAEETYNYVLDTLDGDIKKEDYTMQTDYYINSQNQLLFTKDYGNTWIKTDLPAEAILETLNFYQDISLKNSSWFISPDDLVPIAYFYGEQPKLKISQDNGLTWKEKVFPINNIPKNITTRIVGFNDQNFGYVALGTDWTMGSGEYKKAYYTLDGGTNWLELNLPENGSRKTLMDFIMLNKDIGLVLLNNPTDNNFPLMYVTKDNGQTWQVSNYSKEILEKIAYISNIDSFTQNDNQFTIKLSQGDASTTKINLTSSDLLNWQFVKTFEENIHTVG